MLVKSTLVGFVLLGSTVALSSFTSYHDNKSHQDIDQVDTEYCETLHEQKSPTQEQIEQCESINQNEQEQYPEHEQYPDQDQNEQIPARPVGDKDQNEQIPVRPVGDKDQVGDYDYETARWVDYGEFKAYKLFEREVVINLHGQNVNEISLFATNSMIEINSAYAYLTNGEVINLIPAIGTYVAEGFTVRSQLVNARPLAIKKIVLSIQAADFKVIHHGKLRVSVGFTR